MKEIKRRSFCAVSSALDILGDKWSLLIIRDIMFWGKNSYGDFLKSEEKIATNILAGRLANLEKAGIISKKTHPENKTKFLYQLTQKGKDLLPLLAEIILWSDKYLDISEAAKNFARQLKADKPGTIEKISGRL